MDLIAGVISGLEIDKALNKRIRGPGKRRNCRYEEVLVFACYLLLFMPWLCAMILCIFACLVDVDTQFNV